MPQDEPLLLSPSAHGLFWFLFFFAAPPVITTCMCSRPDTQQNCTGCWLVADGLFEVARMISRWYRILINLWITNVELYTLTSLLL